MFDKAFRYLSALTINASKMFCLQQKYVHTMKKECNDFYCIHSYFIGDTEDI